MHLLRSEQVGMDGSSLEGTVSGLAASVRIVSHILTPSRGQTDNPHGPYMHVEMAAYRS